MGTPGCPYLRGVYIFMTPASNEAGVKTGPVQTLKVPVLCQTVVPSWCFYLWPFFLIAIGARLELHIPLMWSHAQGITLSRVLRDGTITTLML